MATRGSDRGAAGSGVLPGGSGTLFHGVAAGCSRPLCARRWTNAAPWEGYARGAPALCPALRTVIPPSTSGCLMGGTRSGEIGHLKWWPRERIIHGGNSAAQRWLLIPPIDHLRIAATARRGKVGLAARHRPAYAQQAGGPESGWQRWPATPVLRRPQCVHPVRPRRRPGWCGHALSPRASVRYPNARSPNRAAQTRLRSTALSEDPAAHMRRSPLPASRIQWHDGAAGAVARGKTLRK